MLASGSPQAGVTTLQSARPSVRMSEGVLDLSHRLSSLKSLLTGVRVTRRGNQLDLFFFIIFFDLIFSWQNPPQGASKEHPRDSKITENLTFFSKSRPQDPSSIGFSVDLCFSHFLGRFVVRFSWKNDQKTQEFLHSCACFFLSWRPLR